MQVGSIDDKRELGLGPFSVKHARVYVWGAVYVCKEQQIVGREVLVWKNGSDKNIVGFTHDGPDRNAPRPANKL